MILWANHVDRGGNKVTNLALSCALGGIGLVGAILTGNFWLSLACLTLSLAGINAARGIFFTIPMRFLSGAALAGGLAFINSIGTAGGFVGRLSWETRRPHRLVHRGPGRAGRVPLRRRRGARLVPSNFRQARLGIAFMIAADNG